MHKVVTLNVPKLYKKEEITPKQSKNPGLVVLTDAIKNTIYNVNKDTDGTYYVHSGKKRFDIDNPAILADKIIFRVDKLNTALARSLAPVYNGASLFETGVEARTAAVLFFYENNQASSKFRIIKSDNDKYKFTSNVDDNQEYFEISKNILYRRPLVK